jgi:hypothetical protein
VKNEKKKQQQRGKMMLIRVGERVIELITTQLERILYDV